MSDIISVEGQGRDEYGARYFQIGASNADLVVSAKTIISQPNHLYEMLTNAGTNCITAKSKKAVLDEVEAFHSDTYNFRVVTRIGHFHNQFILPHRIFGKPTPLTHVVLDDLGHAMWQKYRSKGSLKNWQEQIVEPARSNSRLMFAISLALTGPILPYVSGPRTGGFQIVGPAENGKTTAAIVAGSVWGCHLSRERQDKGFSESWHTTAGKVELTALAHNHTFLVLDETRLAGADPNVRAHVLLNASFALAEGAERDRLTNVGPLRASQLYYLSTSNETLHQIALAGKREIDNAHRGRLFDVPCPGGEHGIYETLHDFSSGEALSDALQTRSRKYFGTAGKRFARELVADRDRGAIDFRRKLEKYRTLYRAKFKAACAGEDFKPLTRVASRFATVYAAGRLAIEYRVLGWPPSDLGRAVLACHLAGLRLRASEMKQRAPDVGELRKRLVAYLAAGRGFIDLAKRFPVKGSAPASQAPAFIGIGKEHGWFYLTKPVLEAVLGQSPATKALLNELQNARHLARSRQGGFVVQRRLYSGATGNENYAWVYAFAPTLIE